MSPKNQLKKSMINLKPHLSEKTLKGAEDYKYTFVSVSSLTKNQIVNYFRTNFNAKPISVNKIISKPTIQRRARNYFKTKKSYKYIVKFAKDVKIPGFEAIK